MSQHPTSLEDFRGTARLFPLPNLVLFPHVIQPLHIFEPRYRQLLADSLADDRLMALALLQPGWEEDYERRPAIFPTVCLGRIFQEERLPDGRYNLLLHGVCRARVREEVKTGKLYRLAHVDLLPDLLPGSQLAEKELRCRLGQAVRGWFSAESAALAKLRQLLAGGLGLGALCDVFSFALPLELEVKRQLLEEEHVERRARLLLRHLEARSPPPKRFPPDFSAN